MGFRLGQGGYKREWEGGSLRAAYGQLREGEGKVECMKLKGD